MVTLSDRAGELLQRLQAEHALAEPPRLVLQEGQLALAVSPPDPRDTILFHDDQPVLPVAPDVAAGLVGCVITTQDTAEGPPLAIMPERSPDGRAPGAGS